MANLKKIDALNNLGAAGGAAKLFKLVTAVLYEGHNWELAPNWLNVLIAVFMLGFVGMGKEEPLFVTFIETKFY